MIGMELTPRQREIAALIAEGLTNDEIADRLALTTDTVAHHVEAILRRLGLQGRTRIAVWAVRQGLHVGVGVVERSAMV